MCLGGTMRQIRPALAQYVDSLLPPRREPQLTPPSQKETRLTFWAYGFFHTHAWRNGGVSSHTWVGVLVGYLPIVFYVKSTFVAITFREYSLLSRELDR